MRMNTTMKRIAAFICAGLLWVLAGVPVAVAGDIYVIAHPDTRLSAELVRDIYIGEKQFAGDIKLTPLDNAAGQADFLGKVLRLDQTRYANLWVKKSFRDALNPPAVKKQRSGNCRHHTQDTRRDWLRHQRAPSRNCRPAEILARGACPRTPFIAAGKKDGASINYYL